MGIRCSLALIRRSGLCDSVGGGVEGLADVQFPVVSANKALPRMKYRRSRAGRIIGLFRGSSSNRKVLGPT